ncbi:MAG: dihydrofolate reductase family protein [Clostridium sp.]
MERKIILNLAISLDGYIASEDGGFDWIVGCGDNSLDTPNQLDFNMFLEDVDLVVMGKNCYDQGFHGDYSNKKVIVATHEEFEDYENIRFVSTNICQEILREKNLNGKNIFLFGGGVLVQPFIESNIIDEYIVGIIPTILGKGRRLFIGNNNKIDLHTEEVSISDGITVIRYSKKL